MTKLKSFPFPRPGGSLSQRRVSAAASGKGHRRAMAANPRPALPSSDRQRQRLVRAHYLPAFSRLGPYDRSLIDAAAWGKPKKRRLFEYWAHEASLLPLALHPLLRWRMARADRGEAGWKGLRLFARERRRRGGSFIKRIRERVPARLGFEEKRGRSGWWQWGDAKQALEWLFWAGHITTATRRGSFERVYDLTERVIPAEILALPTPDKKTRSAPSSSGGSGARRPRRRTCATISVWVPTGATRDRVPRRSGPSRAG